MQYILTVFAQLSWMRQRFFKYICQLPTKTRGGNNVKQPETSCPIQYTQLSGCPRNHQQPFVTVVIYRSASLASHDGQLQRKGKTDPSYTSID